MKLILVNIIVFFLSFISLATSQVDAISFLNNKTLSNAHAGICIQNLNSGEILLSYNQNKLFTPASTMKLITSYVSLLELGSSYTFSTAVGHTGSIQNDTLYGSLIIRGSGDPTLGSDDFLKSLSLEKLLQKISEILKNEGINYITEDIIIDNSKYQAYGEADRWPYRDIGNYYGATSDAINIHENYYSIYFARSKVSGRNTTIHKCNPEVDSIQWNNQVKTASKWSGDQAYIFGSPFTWKREIRGTIPAGSSLFSIKGSLPFPALHLGLWLAEELKKQKIIIDGRVKVDSEVGIEKFSSLGIIESPQLNEILQEMNERSVNLYAEALVKEISVHNKGNGSTKDGLKIIAEELENIGIEDNQFNLVDGSGLSPFNGISPEAYCKLLTAGMRNNKISSAFANVMAVYGRTGTLRYLFNNYTLEGSAIGKSGSISGVRAYTGIMTTQKGNKLAFSFFLDNFYGKWSDVKTDFEKFMTQIAQEY